MFSGSFTKLLFRFHNKQRWATLIIFAHFLVEQYSPYVLMLLRYF